jgi:hypothetical protein
MHVSERVTAVCSNQREETETTDKQIHSPGLTDESIRDEHTIYYSRFFSTPRLKFSSYHLNNSCFPVTKKNWLII